MYRICNTTEKVFEGCLKQSVVGIIAIVIYVCMKIVHEQIFKLLFDIGIQPFSIWKNMCESYICMSPHFIDTCLTNSIHKIC